MNARFRSLHSLPPPEIKAQLNQLIRRYLERRSTVTAAAVVRHLEALCAHPDYRGSWEDRCAYRRLARHWNGLAWITAVSPCLSDYAEH